MLSVLVSTYPLAADQRRLVSGSGGVFWREVGRKANLQTVFDVKWSRRFWPVVALLFRLVRRCIRREPVLLVHRADDMQVLTAGILLAEDAFSGHR
ncbi:hypothetical protein T4B_13599 [Trichinella pseudospiralis]|uniref:Uncharacterized protein n=1 Tax=Trichinella pseudospiralis TaxID=6337 RepID=A0A0V1JY70_TRIPS|nr:hypothetical protein T4A_8160 [Trichinella pseudospiralis]KRZ27263.1 hypothetical protein T4B_13599 [Trichinella pseudospiralis]KRZ39901.1 hypothetical protein T4C_12551 [Trichinella pseudospiralis]